MQPSTTNNRKQDQQTLDFPTDFEAIQKRVEAIRPKRYAKTRNFINGDVTYLSPYISRGVISTKYVLDFLKAEGYKKYEVEKFVQELAWRDYWQTLWKDQGDAINSDFKRPQPDVKHHKMVAAVDQAETGIDAIDSAIEQLYSNGYMHNHIRMYTAAITCNQGGAHWKQPARWMYYHLLDGDWASNALSWQWVAGSNAGKKYIANQDNINKYTFSKQKGTFLDVTYEELAVLEQPGELAASSDWNLDTPLPKTAELQIDESLPTAVYNYYNLDPQWLDNQDMNRIMLWEPEVFEQYPIGQKAVNFAIALGENIPNLQHFVGSFNALEANLGASKIHFKEHPLNTDYRGTEHPRDWMTSVQGTHRSFFAFWKKSRKGVALLSRPGINIVWLKRDLRSQDHEPLAAAEAAGIPYLILYLFEPSLLAHPECSLRHNQFILGSLQDLKKTLAVQGRSLSICYADAVVVLSEILQKYSVKKLFSYRESGVQLSWDRDKEVARLCLENNIEWMEFQREGVLRGIQNRDGWDKAWYVKMHSPLINNSFDPNLALDWKHEFQIPETLKQAWSAHPTAYQAPGETMGWKYLKSFCEERGRNYMRQISKPLGSRYSCGRVSPYLAWGCLSVKQIYQYVKNHPNEANNKRAFNGFLTRVKWRSHFIQKFEVECEYESLCVNRGYEYMDWQRNEAFIKAWKSGQTGYPMVDANMRCLQATGWINFRMRAMLVSFFCHHLGQDWRDGVYHLAQLFLDYEPGIHYPQFQMQAGTTGVNTVRMYNPVKQGLDHDPDGEFVKQWVPELQEVPTSHIHQPWTLTPMEQQFMNFELGVDYPLPLVDLESSGKAARQRIYGHRKHPQVQKEKQRILKNTYPTQQMKTKYTHTDIAQMDRIKRLHLINSITGVKPANLIGTVSQDGHENLAVFSSVVHLGSNPPFIGFVLRPHFEFRRDTYNNMEQNGYYTINHVPATHTKQAHYTSAKFDEGVSEFERCGFTPEYLNDFPAPFVKESPVKIGLKKVNEIPIPQNGTLFVIGQIELIEVPNWVDEVNGKLNLEKLEIAGISGLNTYYRMQEVGDYPYARVEEVPPFDKSV